MSTRAERPRLAALAIADPAAAWERLGFSVADGVCSIATTALQLDADGDGVTAWALDGAAGDLDGLRCVPQPLPSDTDARGEHPNAITGIDHVVVATPDFDRTVAALSNAGIDVRGVVAAHAGGRPVRRGFGLLREALVEVVGPEAAEGTGPATFWGLTLVSADLAVTAASFGAALGQPRDAVQPGRRIAVATEAAGLSVRLAVMTPR